MSREGDWYWQRSLSPIEDFVWAEGRPSLGIDGNYLCLSGEQGFLAADCDTESKAVACYLPKIKQSVTVDTH